MHLSRRFRTLALAGSLALAFSGQASADASGIRISEWLYGGTTGEYVELSNFGSTAIDLTGWSYDDDSRTPGGFSLSGFGIVQPGESVVFTEASVAAFRAAWSLAASVDVLGSNTVNLGRADEINIFDSGGALVDRLTYGDEVVPGSIRTNPISGRPNSLAAIGANDVLGWTLSSVGDIDMSRQNGTTIGSPGFSSFAVASVPEPEGWAMMLAGLWAATRLGRRKR